jgi:hypothetical protein
MEKDHLALQVFKVVDVLSGFLLGDEEVPVGIAGVKDLGSRFLILGLGQELLPADLPPRGAQDLTHPSKIITYGFGGLGSSSGASAATQGQDEDEEKKRTEKVHGTTLLYLRDYRKTRGSARQEKVSLRNLY